MAHALSAGQVLATKTGGIPASVRPWVHMFKQHDSVSIAPPHEIAHGMSTELLPQASPKIAF